MPSHKSLSGAKITLVVAVSQNGCIGCDNKLPWYLPEDLSHFRKITKGHTVIMGRKTWESLPSRFKPLPGRRNIVLTANADWSEPGAQTAQSIPEALGLLEDFENVFVIGGAKVYEQVVPVADTIEMTQIHQDFQGDAYFPLALLDEFQEVQHTRLVSSWPNTFEYSFITFRKKSTNT
jgi:dihydrofolate reductase